jgi:hypothetical protein
MGTSSDRERSGTIGEVVRRDRYHDRLFQRSVAKVTVGAVGPNAAQFLQATNFVSRSLLIQRSDEAQKGHGCNGPETGIPGVRSETGFSPSFLAITS